MFSSIQHKSALVNTEGILRKNYILKITKLQIIQLDLVVFDRMSPSDVLKFPTRQGNIIFFDVVTNLECKQKRLSPEQIYETWLSFKDFLKSNIFEKSTEIWSFWFFLTILGTFGTLLMVDPRLSNRLITHLSKNHRITFINLKINLWLSLIVEGQTQNAPRQSKKNELINKRLIYKLEILLWRDSPK